jgi:hypothetical protein
MQYGPKLSYYFWGMGDKIDRKYLAPFAALKFMTD